MTDKKLAQKSTPWRLHHRERRVLLVIGDFIMALISTGFALYFWASGDRWLGLSLEFLEKRPPTWFFFMPLIWIVLLVELYDANRAGDRKATIRNIATATLVGLVIYLFVYFTSEPNSLPRRWVAVFFGGASILTLCWRLFYIQIFTAPQLMRRVLLVGGGEAGQTLLKIVKDLWPPPFYITGILDDDPEKLGDKIEGYEVLGNSESLLEVVEEWGVSDIIVAISGEMHGKMFQALLETQERGVGITRMPRVYEDLLSRVPIRFLKVDWLLRSYLDESSVSGFYQLGKRILDIIGGVFGVMILLIMLPFVAIAILVDSGRPVFYSQRRLGRGALPYQIIKFRTMRKDAEPDGKPQWAEEEDERATRVGRILRKTHIDELPQFLNVIRGNMSLVGPRAERPKLVKHFEKHVPFYRARLQVKPGITGWAQVNFGYASSIEDTIEKLEYDLYYIKHRSMLVDILILLRTPANVLGFRGR